MGCGRVKCLIPDHRHLGACTSGVHKDSDVNGCDWTHVVKAHFYWLFTLIRDGLCPESFYNTLVVKWLKYIFSPKKTAAQILCDIKNYDCHFIPYIMFIYNKNPFLFKVSESVVLNWLFFNNLSTIDIFKKNVWDFFYLL